MTPVDLLVLLQGRYSSLTIGFNEAHAPNYCPASEWGEYRDDDSGIDWVSPDEREKAIATNSVWTIQWYPDTPIGFNCVAASTFEAAARYALEHYR